MNKDKEEIINLVNSVCDYTSNPFTNTEEEVKEWITSYCNDIIEANKDKTEEEIQDILIEILSPIGTVKIIKNNH